MPFCTNCGYKAPEGSLFCESCGARLETAAPPAPPVPPPEGTSWGPVQPPAADPGPATPGPADQTPQQPPAYGGQSPYSRQAPHGEQPPHGGQTAGQPSYGAAPAYGQPAAAAAAKPREPRKPLPLGVKIGIIAAAVLVLAFAAVYFILNKLNDPQKTIKTFVDSIITQDFDSFQSVTVCASPDIELTEASVAPFFALYSDNTSMLSSFQDSLTSDLQLLEQGLATTGNGLIRLTEEDHIIFKSYAVELSPVKAVFTSPLSNAKVTIAGNTLDLPSADREYSLSILPGRYELKATAADSTWGSTFTYENKSLSVGASGITSSLGFEYATVILIRQGLDPTSFTINGKSYAVPAYDGYGNVYLSPLPVDAQLTATFDYAGVTLSASFTCDGPYESYFYLDPTLDPDCAPTLLNTAADLTNDWLRRYADGDADGIQALCGGRSSFLSSLAYQLRNSLNTDYWRYAYHYTLRELEGDLNLSRTNDFYAENSPCFSTLLFLGLDYTEEYLAPSFYQAPEPDDPYEPDFGEPDLNDPDVTDPDVTDPDVTDPDTAGPDVTDPDDPGQDPEPETPPEPEVHSESVMLKVYIQYVDGAWQVVGYDRSYNTSRSSISSPYALM